MPYQAAIKFMSALQGQFLSGGSFPSTHLIFVYLELTSIKVGLSPSNKMFSLL